MSEKRKIYPLKLSMKEKRVIQEKAELYRYQYVSSYIRDACVHEAVFIEDIKGKKEILQHLSELTRQVKLLTKAHRYAFRLGEVQEDDQQLLKSIEQLSQEINERLILEKEKVR